MERAQCNPSLLFVSKTVPSVIPSISEQIKNRDQFGTQTNVGLALHPQIRIDRDKSCKASLPGKTQSGTRFPIRPSSHNNRAA